MNAPRVLYQMARADFLERIRRYSFLVTLAAALLLAYNVAAENVWIVVGNGYRGVYNSAWIGMLMTVCCSTFLSLVGFYIVKNSVQRDSDTRVGQILAATPMRKPLYTAAKTLSNFAVLACMVFILMIAALVMQLMRAEAHSFSLWKLWSPFIFLALPSMLLAAAMALLFETLPVLRGGVGNVIYFFLWTAALGLGATGFDDPSGLQLLYRSARTTLQAIDPSSPQNFHFSLTIGGQRALRTFPWNGIDWTASVLLMRLLWIGVAAGITLLASIFFHRFDPARSWRKQRGQAADASQAASTEERLASLPRAIPISAPHLTPLARTSARLAFPATRGFRASADAQRSKLVVVHGGGGTAGRRSGFPALSGAPGSSACGMDLAAPDLVANGLPREPVFYRPAVVLIPAHAHSPIASAVDCGSGGCGFDRRWCRRSALADWRLAESGGVDRRGLIHSEPGIGARNLEWQPHPVRSAIHRVVVCRSRASTSGSRLHGNDVCFEFSGALCGGYGGAAGSLLWRTPPPPELCLNQRSALGLQRSV